MMPVNGKLIEKVGGGANGIKPRARRELLRGEMCLEQTEANGVRKGWN